MLLSSALILQLCCAGEEEEDLAPPARSSLDHYLRQPLKASHTADDSGMTDEPQSDRMGEWDTPSIQLDASSAARSPSKPQGSPNRGFATKPSGARQGFEGSGKMLPDGKRLTALLLDKLQGHEGHLPSRQDSGSGPVSPTGHSHSHDSGSSMAGYQSPFESLAYEVRSEGTDSVKAEDGSVKSFSMAQAD